MQINLLKDQAELVIKDTKGKKDAKFIIAGPASDTAKQVKKDAVEAALKARREGDEDELTADSLINQEKFISKMILGWENLELDGVEFEYSYDNAVRLLRGAPDLFVKIKNFVDEAENFI